MRRALLLVEIATVGFPFCLFKLMTGKILLGTLPFLGWPLIALGVADAIINAASLGFEQQKLHIHAQIAELRAMLPGGGTTPAAHE